ncbi:MAG: siderophore biosynthesis protein, partial [Actinomadura sp.]
AIAEPVIADRPGKLTAAPGPVRLDDGPVRLAYLPQRAVGDTVTITRTNRDYLGTVRVIGPGPDEVDAALARFRAGHEWTIA